jgi:hypothetical protein
MPFRYWDRYVPECDDPELAYFQFDVNQPGAFFRHVNWTERLLKPNIGIRVLCRTDARVPWDAPPNTTPGLYLFDRPRKDEVKNEIMTQGTALEVRVCFEYKPGAFDGTTLTPQSWKETPVLEDVGIDYFAPPIVLSREELR